MTGFYETYNLDKAKSHSNIRQREWVFAILGSEQKSKFLPAHQANWSRTKNMKHGSEKKVKTRLPHISKLTERKCIDIEKTFSKKNILEIQSLGSIKVEITE